MGNKLQKNGSGYWDGVAYQAILHADKEAKKEKKMVEIKRGDIIEHETKNGAHTLSVVVSADEYNSDENNKLVAICALSEKKYSDLCVPYKFKGKEYINCATVGTAYKSICGNYLRSLKEEEMEAVDDALRMYLNLEYGCSDDSVISAAAEVASEHKAEIEQLKADLANEKDKNEDLNDYIDSLVEENKNLRKELQEYGNNVDQHNIDTTKELIRAEAERDIYKELFKEQLRGARMEYER